MIESYNFKSLEILSFQSLVFTFLCAVLTVISDTSLFKLFTPQMQCLDGHLPKRAVYQALVLLVLPSFFM